MIIFPEKTEREEKSSFCIQGRAHHLWPLRVSTWHWKVKTVQAWDSLRDNLTQPYFCSYRWGSEMRDDGKEPGREPKTSDFQLLSPKMTCFFIEKFKVRTEVFWPICHTEDFRRREKLYEVVTLVYFCRTKSSAKYWPAFTFVAHVLS